MPDGSKLPISFAGHSQEVVVALPSSQSLGAKSASIRIVCTVSNSMGGTAESYQNVESEALDIAQCVVLNDGDVDACLGKVYSKSPSLLVSVSSQAAHALNSGAGSSITKKTTRASLMASIIHAKSQASSIAASVGPLSTCLTDVLKVPQEVSVDTALAGAQLFSELAATGAVNPTDRLAVAAAMQAMSRCAIEVGGNATERHEMARTISAGITSFMNSLLSTVVAGEAPVSVSIDGLSIQASKVSQSAKLRPVKMPGIAAVSAMI